MTEQVSIREGRPSDLATIVDFNIKMASETEALKLDHATVTAGTRNARADEHKGRYHTGKDVLERGHRIEMHQPPKSRHRPMPKIKRVRDKP